MKTGQGQSNADFISKPSTALKEASETECRPGSIKMSDRMDLESLSYRPLKKDFKEERQQ